jgi:hypothetical protein
MKKLILLFSAVLLIIGCASNKKEIIEDPIFPQNKIIFDENGKQGYLVEDPLFPENYILFGPEGKEVYNVADPLFEGNYLVFPEPK